MHYHSVIYKLLGDVIYQKYDPQNYQVNSDIKIMKYKTA